ncbi:MAG: phosphoribosylaminoimidazolesuccinocarboxamide synthase [Nitrosomonadales bacterium]
MKKIQSLELFHQGKVRDTYIVDERHFLMVTSDRISAFDVIMNEDIPGKGKVLSQVSNFWFNKTKNIIKNHLTDIDPKTVVSKNEEELVVDRSVVVKRLTPLPVEAIIRGYIIGSGWKDYIRDGQVCGIQLPSNLKLAQKLDDPIFTPSTKAQVGDHDINISYEEMENLIGNEISAQIVNATKNIYKFAADYAKTRGIIIADTKFEFGLDENQELVLMDEILTPDSSRFWPADTYQIGTSPTSFDKQYLRDWLETVDWNKKAPPPRLPDEVISKTIEKYKLALKLLTND